MLDPAELRITFLEFQFAYSPTESTKGNSGYSERSAVT